MSEQFYYLAIENSHLKQIMHTMNRGYHLEAIKQLEKIEIDGKEKNYELIFLLIENYIAIGDFPKAQQLLNTIDYMELEKNGAKQEIYVYSLGLAKTYLYAGQFEQSEQWWDNAWKLKEEYTLTNQTNGQKLDTQQMETDLLYIKGKIAHFRGNFDQAIEYFDEAMVLSEKNDFKSLQFHILNTIAITYYEKGNLEASLELFKKAIKIVEYIKNKFLAVRIIGNMGLIYFDLGLVDEAIEHHKGAQHIAEEINDLSGIAINLHNIGRCFIFKGELNLALEYMFKSSEFFRDLNQKDSLAITFLNIGEIYYSRGQLLEACEFYQEIINMTDEINKRTLGVALTYLGLISYEQNDNESAMSFLEKGLHILKERNISNYIPKALFHIIQVAIDMEKMDISNKYLMELENFNENTSGTYIKQLSMLAKGLILSQSLRVRDRGRAEEIFREIIQCKNCHYEHPILALYNLCKLLIKEYLEIKDNNVIKELESLNSELSEIAENKKNYKLLLESHLIKSQLLIINGKISEAKKLLNTAEKIAREQEIHRLEKIISLKIDELLNQFNVVSKETNDEYSEEELKKYALTHLDEILQSLAQQKSLTIPDLAPDKPIRFLIMDNKSGITIYSNDFSNEFGDDNQQLLGGLLTALSDFSKEIFNNVLDTVKIGDHSIIFANRHTLTYCYVYQGSSYFAKQKLESFLKYIENNKDLLDNLEYSAQSGYIFGKDILEHLDSSLQDFFF